ncbi:MAG: FecR domain-containing protein [Chthoniobacterales bacterium]
MSRNLLTLFIATVFLSTLQALKAGPLTSAEVTKVINRVSVIDPARGEHPAALRDVLKDDLALQTGERSRSELLFQDNTLTRIGAETFFSFKTGTRDLTLEKGTMLLQVPKGLGGAKIHTAAVTAAITGTTIMMEYIPNQHIKVLVLEGSLRLSKNGVFGDSVVLRPGKMVIMRPDARKIPDPIDVDLKNVVKTSTLVNFPGEAPLPSMSLIQAAITDQNRQIAKNNLIPTNLIVGDGTKVVIASPDRPLRPGVQPAAAIVNNGNSAPDAGAAPVPSGNQLPAALAGSVTDVTGSVAGAATGTVSDVIGGATSVATGTVSDVSRGATSVATGTVGDVIGGATSAATGTVGDVTSSATRVTTGVVVGVTGAVGAVTNNLLGPNAAGPTVSISSTDQVLSLLNNAARPVAGTITIVPAAAGVVANAGRLPPVANVAAGTVNGAGGIAALVPVAPNLVPAPTGNGLPLFPAANPSGSGSSNPSVAIVPSVIPPVRLPLLGAGH